MSQQPIPITNQPKPPQWELEERDGTGIFAVSRAGALLFRVEVAIGAIYLWDKKASREIQVRLSDLIHQNSAMIAQSSAIEIKEESYHGK